MKKAVLKDGLTRFIDVEKALPMFVFRTGEDAFVKYPLPYPTTETTVQKIEEGIRSGSIIPYKPSAPIIDDGSIISVLSLVDDRRILAKITKRKVRNRVYEINPPKIVIITLRLDSSGHYVLEKLINEKEHIVRCEEERLKIFFNNHPGRVSIENVKIATDEEAVEILL